MENFWNCFGRQHSLRFSVVSRRGIVKLDVIKYLSGEIKILCSIIGLNVGFFTIRSIDLFGQVGKLIDKKQFNILK